jgi:hypothetical protein
MEVKTANPVVIDNTKISTIDSIVNEPLDEVENSYDAGNLKVTTANPVIYSDANVLDDSFYSNIGGDKEPSIQEKLDRKQKRKEFWNKAKGTWEKISQSPAAQFALQQLAAYQAQKQGITDGSQIQPSKEVVSSDSQAQNQSMSKTTKIVLGVAGVLVVGLIIYAVLSGDSKTKAKPVKIKK